MKPTFFMLFLGIILSSPLRGNLDKGSQDSLADTYFKPLFQHSSIEIEELSHELLYQTYTAQPLDVLKNMKKCILLDLETLSQVELENSSLLKETLQKRLELLDAALACYEPQTELECEQSLAWSIIIESTVILGIIGLGAIIYTTPNNTPAG